MKRPAIARLHGFLPVYKPPDCTSFDVIRRFKPVLGKTKTGHAGTLDPMATGLLPLCLGEATKLVRFLPNQKRYRAIVRLGKSTDTLDRTGTIIHQSVVPRLDQEVIENCLKDFRGEITQIPPMYSALHHQGKRLYEIARQGQETDRKPRTVTINELSLVDHGIDWLEIDVACTTGTYIRSLVSDIAVKLGTVGHLSELERTSCSGWQIEQAHPLHELVSLEPNRLSEYVVPIESALSHLTRVDVSSQIAASLSMGRKLSHFQIQDCGMPSTHHPQPFWLRPPDGSPIAMVRWTRGNEAVGSADLEILRMLDLHRA